jgi:hemerythrin-like domain-containing protein
LPTRDQIRTLLDEGFDYPGAARELGIPAGQAYLIATGRPADGGDTPSAQEVSEGGLLPASQDLANPQHENPTSSKAVRDWIAGRIAADSQMQAAAAARTAEPAQPGSEDASADLLDVLARQHNQVRALQEQLEALPGHRKGGAPDDLAVRKSIVDLITVHLSQHETAEEAHLWPAVRTVLPDGDDWANQALEQEQEGKDTLTALGRLDPDTGEFDDLVEQLVQQLRKHVAFEERVFLRLREAMPEQEREKLGKKVLRASKRAPTRPHPHAPKEPGVAVKAAAPGAAAADKLRDAAGDRPASSKGRPE